jgi:hypothetical protein
MHDHSEYDRHKNGPLPLIGLLVLKYTESRPASTSLTVPHPCSLNFKAKESRMSQRDTFRLDTLLRGCRLATQRLRDAENGAMMDRVDHERPLPLLLEFLVF